jgi:membrane-bound lytic murein transglycosylase D
MEYKRTQNEERRGRGSAWLVFALFVTVAGAATLRFYDMTPLATVTTRLALGNKSASTAPMAETTPPWLDDAILTSPMFQDQRFLAEVHKWVTFWETRHSKWVPSYLERMTWFEGNVDAVLAEHELPWSLRFLPVLESGYSTSAVSSASAVGLWQFMEPTAKDFGMEVTPVVDERRDPFKSTDAAAKFLSELHDEFDSWFLALAAYNAGPARIRGILRRHAPGAPMSDSLYWAVREHLPAETRDFVPKFLGAVFVAANPEAHGYERPTARPFRFDRVLVTDQTSLSAIARAADTTHDEIKRLNPEFIGGVTPPRRNSYVRVPLGSASLVQRNATRRSEGGGG